MTQDHGNYDVLVVGDANPDLILSGDGASPRFGQVETLVDSADLVLGGSGAIAAAGLARLGLRTALLAAVGDDSLGHLTIDQLERTGVDTSHVVVDPGCTTGVSVHLVAGDDRAIVTHLGAIAGLRPEHIDDRVVTSARHVHVASVFLIDGIRHRLPTMLEQARRIGASTSIDTNWDPAERWDIAEILAHCDMVFPNEQEAVALGDCSELEQAMMALSRRHSTVVVKRGDAGAVVVTPQGRHSVAAPSAIAVDAIGAGDSFDAGYIAGTLFGLEPPAALALGVACGSLSVRAAGGTEAQPSRAEAESLAATLR